MGLCGEGVERYVEEWIVGVQDITEMCQRIYGLVQMGELAEAKILLPKEKIYVVQTSRNNKPTYS